MTAEYLPTPGSTALTGAEYDPETSELTVYFTSGEDVTYAGVPPGIFEGLKAATSRGQYYVRWIKGKY